jgi:hypothetical protein
MHNHRSLFNMDISGGMPAVIIKMLVASDPGKLKLLPALPAAWPAGTIEGVLCRGQIEVKRLRWDANGLEVTLRSAKPQQVTLELPYAIAPDAPQTGAGGPNQRTLALPAATDVTIRLNRQR